MDVGMVDRIGDQLGGHHVQAVPETIADRRAPFCRSCGNSVFSAGPEFQVAC